MSELTQCNYCNYQQLLREAKEKNMIVSLAPADWGNRAIGGPRERGIWH